MRIRPDFRTRQPAGNIVIIVLGIHAVVQASLAVVMPPLAHVAARRPMSHRMRERLSLRGVLCSCSPQNGVDTADSVLGRR
jgi:hypothetical protein